MKMKIWLVEDTVQHMARYGDYLREMAQSSSVEIEESINPDDFWRDAKACLVDEEGRAIVKNGKQVARLTECDLLYLDINFPAGDMNGDSYIKAMWKFLTVENYPFGYCTPLLVCSEHLQVELSQLLRNHQSERPFYDCFAVHQKTHETDDMDRFETALLNICRHVSNSQKFASCPSRKSHFMMLRKAIESKREAVRRMNLDM